MSASPIPAAYAGEHMTTRFFYSGDEHSERIVFDLPAHWWSRPYEYTWAASFAIPGQVVLDAASGLCHPLKFCLLEQGCIVHACDLDPRISSPTALLAEVGEVYGADAAHALPRRYLDEISYAQANLTHLPYANDSFDTIFCISVLEHLDEPLSRRYRRLRALDPGGLVGAALMGGLAGALSEFRRVLKPNGLLILTFDYPRVDLRVLYRLFKRFGLAPAGTAERKRPADALYNKHFDLFCYRAALRRLR